jgi:hypothetical protein
MGDEQLPRRIQDGPGDGLPLTFLTFLDTQVLDTYRFNTVFRLCAEQCSVV